MSRKIKFRLLREHINSGHIIADEYDLQEIEDGDHYEWATGRVGGKHYSLRDERLQYTGLLDKNGVEIYEGDIYILYNRNGGKKPTKANIYFKGFVRGEENLWYGFTHQKIWSSRAESNDYKYCPYSRRKDCVVIGNIYENPELLTTNK